MKYIDVTHIEKLLSLCLEMENQHDMDLIINECLRQIAEQTEAKEKI